MKKAVRKHIQKVQRKNAYIWVSSYHRRFYPWRDNDDEISIIDIAVGLSRIARWAGQGDRRITVAEHSLNVVEYLRENNANTITQFYGLLHDASEAYTTDMPAPWKQFLPDFQKLERRIQKRIFRKFGVDQKKQDINIGLVHAGDVVMRLQEADQLFGGVSKPNEYPDHYVQERFVEKFFELEEAWIGTPLPL